MKIFAYRDYAHYVRAQTAANREKIDHVWVSRSSIRAVARHFGDATSVLCHGTRNAAEQRLFLESYPGATILGTEIAASAWRFPMTVRWDMQKSREDWIGRFDVVYSNSIDHVIYPEKAIRTWIWQLATGGCLYIEHANAAANNISSETDPFEISDDEMAALIEECGGRIETTFDGLGGSNSVTRIYAVRCA